MDRKRIFILVGLVFILVVAAAVYFYFARQPDLNILGGNKIELISSFTEGSKIPVKYTCDGENISPAMAWTDIPKNTRSLVLIVDDPDAPAGTWTHWVVFNIPSQLTGLAEGSGAPERGPGSGEQGQNSAGGVGYTGPCPPEGTLHNYAFKLYALDIRLDLAAGASREQVEAALQRHILAEGQLTGTYER